MIRPLRPDSMGYLEWLAGSDIKKGQVCYYDTAEAKATAEGVASAIILGVAVEDAADAATVKLYNPRQQFEISLYQGGSVDVATDAMKGIDYDIYVDGAAGDDSAEGEMYLDLNDVTDPMFNLHKYDNTRRVAIVTFIEALLYV